MTNFIRAAYRGLAKLCLVVLVFTLVGCTSGAAVSATSKNTANIASGKINLCDHGLQDLPQLEAELRDRILGKRVPDLSSLFQNEPARLPFSSKFGESKQKQIVTNLPPGGSRHSITFGCPISNGNMNGWLLGILANKAGKVTVIQLELFYSDKDFSARDETPTPYRFWNSQVLAEAVDKWARKNALTRDEFHAEFLSAGFLFNRSCKLGNKASDVYITPLVPPDRISALMGNYLHLNLPPAVSVVFSADSGKFSQALSGERKGAGDCQVSKSIYGEQIEDWLKTNYPGNWFTVNTERERAEQLIRGKVKNWFGLK